MKLFLIDAYALIYRSYYAFIKNPRINSKGMNTSAIFGFINSLEDVLKRENPTHIAVASTRKVRLPPRSLRTVQGATARDAGRYPQVGPFHQRYHRSLQHPDTGSSAL